MANAPESVSSEHANETVLTSPQEEALRQYRLTLAREARRFSQFLVRAREQGWSGIVTLRIRLQPGIEPDISLGRSSGHEVLDGQAAGLVASAIRTAMLPEALLGRSLSFDLAIRYALDD